MAVLDVRRTSDGAVRGAIALEGGGGKLLGWITIITRDSVENVTLLDPQPNVQPPAPLGSNARSGSDASQRGSGACAVSDSCASPVSNSGGSALITPRARAAAALREGRTFVL